MPGVGATRPVECHPLLAGCTSTQSWLAHIKLNFIFVSVSCVGALQGTLRVKLRVGELAHVSSKRFADTMMFPAICVRDPFSHGGSG